MARHRKSSLYGRGIAGFHEFIQKKVPHNLAVLSSSFMLDPTMLIEIAVY